MKLYVDKRLMVRWIAAFILLVTAADLYAKDGTWMLMVDCFKGGVEHTGTKNDITVGTGTGSVMGVFNSKDKARSSKPSATDRTCKTAGMTVQFLPGVDMTGHGGWGWGAGPKAYKGKTIRLHAGGDDAFWIDRIEVLHLGSGPTRRWGVNNGKGWCLSNDSSDTFGSSNQSSACEGCWEFNADTRKAKKC